eukprot:GAHX01000796.1.p1 GENE.GAHX01000796.1~~GAHX01000796.1.p1  ORF type:complete len:176 (-),score=22.48 GAHX01000796.1:46-573(-)
MKYLALFLLLFVLVRMAPAANEGMVLGISTESQIGANGPLESSYVCVDMISDHRTNPPKSGDDLKLQITIKAVKEMNIDNYQLYLTSFLLDNFPWASKKVYFRDLKELKGVTKLEIGKTLKLDVTLSIPSLEKEWEQEIDKVILNITQINDESKLELGNDLSDKRKYQATLKWLI